MLKNGGRRGLRGYHRLAHPRVQTSLWLRLDPSNVPHFPAPTIFTKGDAPWTHLGWYQLRFDETTNLPFSARSPYPS
ncbi:hypothetical protein TNCV_973721 [Trichonephila clavipes]|nr:hypothetical protein TNCV_973721 [Trichonephila clavipes]